MVMHVFPTPPFPLATEMITGLLPAMSLSSWSGIIDSL
jgi:hypothetical protein